MPSNNPMVALDWSSRRGVHYTFDGETVTNVANLDALLDVLVRPTDIYLERTFESYSLEARARFERRCARAGHTLHTIDPRQTDRRRREEGWDKTDENDARVLWKLAQKRTHFHVGNVPDVSETFKRRQEDARRDLMITRCTGRREEYAEQQIARLPPFETLDPRLQKVLVGAITMRKGQPRYMEYNATLVSAVAKAAEHHIGSRAEFEQMVGLHGNGHRSIFRSDIYHHAWSRFDLRAQEKRKKGPGKLAGVATLSEFRRGVRWLYHHLKKAA
jgi:hypothetical protein